MKKKSLIEEANERVRIELVCRLVGVDIEDGLEGRSVKTYCPFGRFFHSDGGKEPALRVYGETNSAYCFSCKKVFNPVSLYAEGFDRTKKQAATDLLEKVGYQPLTAAQLWDEVSPVAPDPDKTMLSHALLIYCERIDPDWQKSQFDKSISSVLDKCLSLIDRVSTDEEAQQWLDTCKLVMRRTLEKVRT